MRSGMPRGSLTLFSARWASRWGYPGFFEEEAESWGINSIVQGRHDITVYRHWARPENMREVRHSPLRRSVFEGSTIYRPHPSVRAAKPVSMPLASPATVPA